MKRRMLGIALLLCVLPAAGGERRAAAYVPADCWLTVCYDGSHPGLKDTPLHQFLQEPEVRAALAQWQPLLDKLYETMDEGSGLPASAVVRATYGAESAVGLGRPDPAGGPQALVASVRVGGAESVARQALDRMVGALREQAEPDTVKETQVGAAKVLSLVARDGGPAHFCFDGEFLIAGNSEPLLRRAVTGEGESLAAKLGEERAALRVRYDHPAALKHFGDQIDAPGRRVLDALGLGAVRTVEVLVVPRGKRLVLELAIDMPEAAKGAGLARWLADAPSLIDRAPACLGHKPRRRASTFAIHLETSAVPIWHIPSTTPEISPVPGDSRISSDSVSQREVARGS